MHYLISRAINTARNTREIAAIMADAFTELIRPTR